MDSLRHLTNIDSHALDDSAKSRSCSKADRLLQAKIAKRLVVSYFKTRFIRKWFVRFFALVIVFPCAIDYRC